jgi:(1->4)-alpha-D-glucan 1-alpha-D-glucosylmutase
MALTDILAQASAGYPKLYLTWSVLQTRRDDPHAFGPASSYQPLNLDGPAARRAVAYLRAEKYLVVAPTLVLGAQWTDTRLRLPTGRWISVFAPAQTFSGELSVAELTREFPVVFLRREPT